MLLVPRGGNAHILNEVGVRGFSLMPGRALPALIVSATERRDLEQLVKRPSPSQ